MLEGNRLFQFLFTFLPALIYAAVIYLSAPYQSIGRRMSQLYFQMGVISATITSWFLWVFPAWQVPLSTDPIHTLLLLSFFQIAFLEEGMKFAMFKATERYRIRRSHPGAIMFYCMCVSTGFAVMENVMYLQLYGQDVLVIRAFSALVLHLITGLLMGYFMSLSIMYPGRRRLLECVAVIVSVFYHGLYDFNIMSGDIGLGQPLMLVLVPGIIITYFMWRHVTTSNPDKL